MDIEKARLECIRLAMDLKKDSHAPYVYTEVINIAEKFLDFIYEINDD